MVSVGLAARALQAVTIMRTEGEFVESIGLLTFEGLGLKLVILLKG